MGERKQWKCRDEDDRTRRTGESKWKSNLFICYFLWNLRFCKIYGICDFIIYKREFLLFMFYARSVYLASPAVWRSSHYQKIWNLKWNGIRCGIIVFNSDLQDYLNSLFKIIFSRITFNSNFQHFQNLTIYYELHV